MYAGVVRYEFDPKRLDDLERLWDAHVVPIARQSPGHRGGFLLLDHDSGRALGIGLWDSAREARAFQDSGALHRALEPLRELLRDEPSRAVYEVVSAGGPGLTLHAGDEAHESRAVIRPQSPVGL